MREHYGVDVPVGADRGDDRFVGRPSTSPSSPCSMPGDRVAITAPGYPAYRNIMAALGLEVGRDRAGRGAGYLTAEALERRIARKAAQGRAVRQPGQPDRRGDPA